MQDNALSQDMKKESLVLIIVFATLRVGEEAAGCLLHPLTAYMREYK